MARAEVFRRNLQKRPDYNAADVRAEGSPAEGRGQPARCREAAGRWSGSGSRRFKQAVLEYHASVQRLKDWPPATSLSAVNLLTRIIDALEAYLRVAPPSGLGLGRRVDRLPTATAPAQLVSIATTVLDEERGRRGGRSRGAAEAEARGRAEARRPSPSNAKLLDAMTTLPDAEPLTAFDAWMGRS